MKFLSIFLFLLGFASCTIPPKRVSTGVVVPRGPILDAQFYSDKRTEKKSFLQYGVGIGKGESFSDNGVVQFGSMYSGSVEFFPVYYWALGLRPFLGINDRETTTRNHFGLEIYHRVRLNEKGYFRFSVFNSLRMAENVDSSEEVFCFIFCQSTGKTSSFARAEVIELSLIPVFELFFNPRNSLVFAPEFIWRDLKSENRHPEFASYAYNQSLYDYALGLYFGTRFGRKENLVLQLGGGYKKRQGFGRDDGISKPGYHFDLHIKTTLGGEETSEDTLTNES